MPTLLIAYDLTSSEAAAPLAEAIMALGARWARPLASVWYVETSASVAEIEVALSDFLHDDDGLLVQQAFGHAAVANTMLRWTPARTAPSAVVPDTDSARIVQWPGTRAGVHAAA